MNEATIRIDGPYHISIEVVDGLESGTVYMLAKDGGEWRLDGLWVAHGRINRFDALARALRMIESKMKTAA